MERVSKSGKDCYVRPDSRFSPLVIASSPHSQPLPKKGRESGGRGADFYGKRQEKPPDFDNAPP